MKTTKHTPKNFDPAKYVAVDFLDNQPPEAFPVFMTGLGVGLDGESCANEVKRQREAYHKDFASFFGWSIPPESCEDGGWPVAKIPHRCEHCHHAIRYVAVIEHRDAEDAEPEYIAFGCDCVKRCDFENRAEFKIAKLKDAASLRAAHERNVATLNAFLEATPRVVEALKLYEQHTVRLLDDGGVDEGGGAIQFSVFVNDIRRKLKIYNELSERQASCFADAVQKEVKQHQDRQQESEAAGPVPVGTRIEIEGELLAIKLHESQYGETLKMLVKLDNGSKLWGSLPAAINRMEWDNQGNEIRTHSAKRGDRIAFTASSIEASRDDESFGFFKRPTKARIA